MSKLPKMSTVCTVCVEIININRNKPILYSIVCRPYMGYWVIEHLHFADCCDKCSMQFFAEYFEGDLDKMHRAAVITCSNYFNQTRVGSGNIVRMDMHLIISICENLKIDLRNWVNKNNGQPQF